MEMGSLEICDFLLSKGCKSQTILTSYLKANTIINQHKYKNILCSISGGSDSDIMLDIIYNVDVDKKVKYVWFDTGLEYQATKDHLKHLEEKYNIEIIREKAIKPIPLTCKQCGQPFLSKFVSQMINILQRNNFKFENAPFEELIKKYPNCKSALKWWTSEYTKTKKFKKPSMYDINYNKYLKDFLIEQPPNFNISSNCCKYAKKDVSKQLIKIYNADLIILGIRRAEGGIRSTAYKNCYSQNIGFADQYRPIFYYTNQDKEIYKKALNIKHSNCYSQYGMTRTGCGGCPFNKKLAEDLVAIKTYEPKLYKAINNIFAQSYQYTQQYHEYISKREREENNIKGQLDMFDYINDKGATL